MSDEALKPCPICGKKVAIARTENEVGERWWFITRGTYRTTRCNCRLFLESEKFTCGWNDDYSLECRAKLIDKWNTRAELGSRTLTAEQAKRIHEIIEKHWHDLPDEYDMPEATALPEYSYDWQAITEELNAELGGGNCARCAEDMGRYADSLCDPLKERIAELLRCLENDWHIHASWDGLRKFWCIELNEEGVRMRDAELGSGTCEWLPVESCHTFAGPGWECSNCGHEVGEYEHDFYNCCPICCAKVVER